MVNEELIRMDELQKVESIKRLWAHNYADAKRRNLSVDEKLLLRHTLIVGATGSGKTNHAFWLLKESAELVSPGSCLIIDVKREYRALAAVLPNKVEVLCVGDEPAVHFNPLIPPGKISPELWDRAFADMFTRAYGLSEPSRRILLDSLFDFRQSHADENPTLRDLEIQVARFKAGSSKEENSQRSLESRLHIINTGPTGRALNTEQALRIESMDGKVTVFEIGMVDSLRDQRFLAELLLLYLWNHDKAHERHEDRLRRLVVVEEAHRYLSEERPPAQRGDRTLLELAIAEARRYGWGFVIIDQMPTLLSTYVWDNMGTIIMHRLTNVDSFERVKDAMGSAPPQMRPEAWLELALNLPEDLCVCRTHLSDVMNGASSVGLLFIPRVKGQRP
jgi:hypothetical protein